MKYCITDNIKKDALNSISYLIFIPSILDKAKEGALFCENIKRALDYILKISQLLGFTTYVDPNGYYGFAEIGCGGEILEFYVI